MKGSSIWVKSWRLPSVTAGRVVVYGLARMLKASIRFQPSISTFWKDTRGVMLNRSLGRIRMAARTPLRFPLFTSS